MGKVTNVLALGLIRSRSAAPAASRPCWLQITEYIGTDYGALRQNGNNLPK